MKHLDKAMLFDANYEQHDATDNEHDIQPFEDGERSIIEVRVQSGHNSLSDSLIDVPPTRLPSLASLDEQKNAHHDLDNDTEHAAPLNQLLVGCPCVHFELRIILAPKVLLEFVCTRFYHNSFIMDNKLSS